MNAESPPEQIGPLRNYFQGATDNVYGLKYRVGGEEVIERVIAELRGGYIRDPTTGAKIINERQRRMNEDGVSAARFFLESSANKITHLTKLEDGEIKRTMKELARKWIKSLGLNMKNWAPPGYMKVRDRHLCVMLVENVAHMSMMRSISGFEAELLSKTMSVQENIMRDNSPRQGGIFGGLFGRRRGENQ